ncbi:hypothetical protein SUDANB176_07631 (plasmid) [Streptomyces sp. enrichment culture]|uniref:pentapeptide repeat-containing protein n=1 Tax=Streptomyces sp. enrichment culture TaxID=1795815 RepID=UPI003F55B196
MEPYGACLEHLTDADRAAYLGTLAPGSDVDHCGTRISQHLLNELLGALHDPSASQPRLGHARFDEAQFSGDAGFHEAQFSGDAEFVGARFFGTARFLKAQFSGRAGFGGARFSGDARFGQVQFSGDARFVGARFSDGAGFGGARFSGVAGFGGARFSGVAGFGGARFSGDARFGRAQFFSFALFGGAQFVTVQQLGPLVCQQMIDLTHARFEAPVTLEAAAARVVCKGTRWDAKATLRLRYAALDLTDAVMDYPLSVTTKAGPFTEAFNEIPEGGLAGSGPSAPMVPAVRVVSLSGADATHLALHNVDLAECRFFGTIHLDQLRLEGQCPLAPAAAGRRWTERRTLAEEHHWRAAQQQPGWTAAPDGAEVHGPAALATVYRQLRKSFEDSKNEPDAADFYYGEMTMRRLDKTRPAPERVLLTAYWAVSGYGLRASRALGWLLGAMAATVLVMMLWGLPASDPKPATTGRLTGQAIALTTDKPDPANPTGPLTSRLTSKRWEKSLRVVVNSVIFRSSGQELTTTGTYIEMASRLTEPVLLALAVLAIRGRVKR